ncbi:MAG: hypothetical protein LBH54_06355, partial [Clostridiales bacterium]|nr:hypothetical protein [Clostridiales bacterium]
MKKTLLRMLAFTVVCAMALGGVNLTYTGAEAGGYAYDDDFTGYTSENAAIGANNAVLADANARNVIASGTTADGVDYQWNTSVVYGPEHSEWGKAAGFAWLDGGLNVHDYWAWVTTANFELKNYLLTSVDEAQFTIIWGFNPTGVRLAVNASETSYIEFGFSGAQEGRAPENVPLRSAYALVVVNGTAAQTAYCPTPWDAGGYRYFDWTVVFDGNEVNFTVTDADDPANTWSGDFSGADVYNLRTGATYPAAFYAKGDDASALANMKLNYSGEAPEVYDYDDDFTGYTSENAAIGSANAVLADANARNVIASGTTADGVDYQWNTSVVYGPEHSEWGKAAGFAWLENGLNVEDRWAWVTAANFELKNYILTSIDKAQFTTGWGWDIIGVRLAVNASETSYIEFGFSGAQEGRAPENVPLRSAYALVVVNGTAVQTAYCPTPWEAGGYRYHDWTVVFDGNEVNFTVTDADDPANTWSGDFSGADVYN